MVCCGEAPLCLPAFVSMTYRPFSPYFMARLMWWHALLCLLVIMPEMTWCLQPSSMCGPVSIGVFGPWGHRLQLGEGYSKGYHWCLLCWVMNCPYRNLSMFFLHCSVMVVFFQNWLAASWSRPSISFSSRAFLYLVASRASNVQTDVAHGFRVFLGLCSSAVVRCLWSTFIVCLLLSSRVSLCSVFSSLSAFCSWYIPNAFLVSSLKYG